MLILSRLQFPPRSNDGCDREPRHYEWSWALRHILHGWQEWIGIAQTQLCLAPDILGQDAKGFLGRAEAHSAKQVPCWPSFQDGQTTSHTS